MFPVCATRVIGRMEIPRIDSRYGFVMSQSGSGTLVQHRFGELDLSAFIQTYTHLLLYRPIEHTSWLSYNQHLFCVQQPVLLLFALHTLRAPRSVSLHRTTALAMATQPARSLSSKDRIPARALNTLARHHQKSPRASLPRRPTKTLAPRPLSHRRHRCHLSRVSRTTERQRPAEATVSQSTVPSPRFSTQALLRLRVKT